jgi:hypothetical protein
MDFLLDSKRPIMTPMMHDSFSIRTLANAVEPKSLRTYTPSQAVLAESAGVFHWTPEGRRLFDFTSGVLVANLGHNPTRWTQRFTKYLNWPTTSDNESAFFRAVPMTSYNAITPLEAQASDRLIKFLEARPGGVRMEHVLWAASDSKSPLGHHVVRQITPNDPRNAARLPRQKGIVVCREWIGKRF